MRIAQVAHLYESVPPKLYGGTERVVSWLTEELVSQGHEVTLFASGDSLTTARLVPICPQALRLNSECVDQLAHHIYLLERVLRDKDEFDLIHFHVDYLHFPLSRSHALPQVTTPYKILPPVVESVKRVVSSRLKLFNGQLKPDEMPYQLEDEEPDRSRGSIKSSTSPMPIAPWRSRTSRKAAATTT